MVSLGLIRFQLILLGLLCVVIDLDCPNLSQLISLDFIGLTWFRLISLDLLSSYLVALDLLLAEK